MDRVEKLAARTLELAAMALMMILVVVIAYSVVGRQFFRISVPWSEEIAAGTLMWMVMLGSAAAWYHRRHLVVDLVMRRVGRRTLFAMTIFVEIASIVLLATAFIGSVSMMSVSAHNSTTALGISYSYLYLGLVIGLGSMILFSLAYLARLFIYGTAILPNYAEIPEWNT